MKRIKSFLENKFYLLLVFLFCFSYFVYFSFFTIARYYNFYPMRYDLGNMVQTVWNTSQGFIFEMTHPEMNKNVSRFAVHGDFFLIFLAPLYKIFPFPEVLLLVQSFFISFSGIFLYFICQKFHLPQFLSLSVVFSYLLNPSLQRSNIYEFHAVSIAPFFVLGSFYFLLQRKWFWFFVFFFLAASTKEQVSLIYFWFGFYIFILYKLKIISFITIFISLAWFLGMVWWIIPHYREGLPHFALKFYDEIGSHPFSILKSIVGNPLMVWQIITTPERLAYLKSLFLPLGFLPIFSPLIFFISSELFINLLSSYQPMRTINYQYTAVITPLLYLALIYSLKNIFLKIKPLSYFLASYLLFFSLWGAYLYGPLPFAKKPNKDAFKPKFSQSINYQKLRTLIPSSASLSVSNNLGAHFAQRRFLYSFPSHYLTADYTLILKHDTYEKVKNDKIAIYISSLSQSSVHKLIYQEGNVYLFKKIK